MKIYLKISLLISILTLCGCSLVVEVKDPPTNNANNTNNTNNGSCGNGFKDVTEACDGFDFGGDKCENHGFTGGTLNCAEDCTLDTAECTVDTCGNGLINAPEQCDGENLNGQSCELLGYAGGGELSCHDDCMFDTTNCEGLGNCGNGIADAGEECDGPDLRNATCASMGWGTGLLGCYTNCAYDASGCGSAPICGDAAITGTESCDGDLLNGQTCESMGFSLGGTLACDAATCNFDTSACVTNICGNGSLEYPEECEVADSTCIDWGFANGGNLLCIDCRYDFSLCVPLSLTHITDVSAGANHSCAIHQNGSVWCWGLNTAGQLGNVNYPQFSYPTPIPVDLGATLADRVVTGSNFTCARITTGQVACWGDNSQGQLGDGNVGGSRVTPFFVSDLLSVSGLSAGMTHTCAIEGTSQSVFCWGYNGQGQLGTNDTASYSTPMDIGLDGVADISAGHYHTCAVRTMAAENGKVYCWGNNDFGQLGNNSQQSSPTPVQVVNLQHIVAVSTGEYHTCALKDTGAVYCWGRNDEGQLGDGGGSNRSVPQEIFPDASGVNRLSSGTASNCVAGSATVGAMCWGRNGNGQLGNNTYTQQSSPVPVWMSSSNDFVDISIFGFHTCAIFVNASGNTVHCWGENYFGQLGDGTREDSPIPVLVSETP